LARLVALLVLIAGLTGAALPGFAAAPAPEPTKTLHAGMDCDGAQQHPAPKPHLPAGDCCLANACAMSLALLTAPTGLALPALAEMPDYVHPAAPDPRSIVITPLPHPPKSPA
jgi:hypothetical protein